MNSSKLSTTITTSTTLAQPPEESRMSFNLLVAYEDQPTRHRALHLSHHLSNQFSDDYEFHCSWWKFDHLANELLREQATHAAAEANMIVLALNARPRLSALQSEWLQSWLPIRQARRTRGAVNGALVALVALVASPEPALASEARQTAEHLRKMAASAHLDFFSHSFELPRLDAGPAEAELELAVAPELPAAPELSGPLVGLDKRHHFIMPIPRWGINE